MSASTLGAKVDGPERWWTAHAKCKGRTRLFFAPAGERPEARARREALARRYCAVCPVRLACRDDARQNHEAGLWGGENDEERARAGFVPRAVTRRAVQTAGASAAGQQPTAS